MLPNKPAVAIGAGTPAFICCEYDMPELNIQSIPLNALIASAKLIALLVIILVYI